MIIIVLVSNLAAMFSYPPHPCMDSTRDNMVKIFITLMKQDTKKLFFLVEHYEGFQENYKQLSY
jgi:hypothetical protein